MIGVSGGLQGIPSQKKRTLYSVMAFQGIQKGNTLNSTFEG
jgi:hypothetical protein